MLVEVKAPEMGESITEGTLTQWYKADGDFVEPEEPLFELETDKITVDVPCQHAGALRIRVAGGSRVRIGEVVATIDTEAARPGVRPDAGGGDRAAPPEAGAAAGAGASAQEDTGRSTVPEGETFVRSEPGEARVAREALSPSVRRTVEEYGLDPMEVQGSGRGGRITKEDVLAHLKRLQAEEDVAVAREEVPACGQAGGVSAAAAETRRQTRTRMSPLRRRIAERLVLAQQTAAILTTFNEADMSGVLALRERHNEAFAKRYGVRLGLISFFLKAAVDALKQVPAINAQIQDDEIVQNHYYDIGVAVSTERGLVVPVIRDADRLGFAEIEKAIADLAHRAKSKALTLSDLTGGVFTLSNGGVYGSLLSTPILNPPQSGILGMHAIKKRPVAVEERIVVRPMMYLALSYDHRLVDGREAVAFLKRIVDCIENPERMLLEV